MRHNAASGGELVRERNELVIHSAKQATIGGEFVQSGRKGGHGYGHGFLGLAPTQLCSYAVVIKRGKIQKPGGLFTVQGE